MENDKSNSRNAPDKEMTGSDTAAQKTETTSHFRRKLVPLDVYAARQGISSEIIEQQGRLGVIQVRKFKGQKYVVDVPAEQLNDFETGDAGEPAARPVKSRPTAASRLFTAGLTTGLVIIIVTVFWLYMDAKTGYDDLNAEFTTLQNRYNELTASNQTAKTIQEELVRSKAELARIQNRIAASKTELEKIQSEMNKARRNLDTIQSDLSAIQGQLSLSKVEIESIQNGLNDSKKDLEDLHRQNTESASP